ncbi:ATP-binding protein [Brevundimonas vesicularis]|uniref:ATP-binding protein n=1 Tax=Brevundimonas vesicularis TaxID=41276 RepID=UPI0038D4FE1F
MRGLCLTIILTASVWTWTGARAEVADWERSDELIQVIEARASVSSFADLETFGEDALERKDREGLNRLYHVFWIFQNQGEYDRAAFWNRYLIRQAAAQRDRRYIEIAALNQLTARYDQGELAARKDMARAYQDGFDWFVRAHAARLLAMALIDEGDIREAMKIISQAEADIPDDVPFADTAHAGLWEMAGMGMMKLHDSLGAAIAFRRFEIDYSKANYPRPDFDSLYNLTSMAVELGDLDRAQAWYEAHHRLSLRTGLENILIYDAGLCAKVAHARSDGPGVLECLAPYGENLGRAAFLALDVLPRRAIARARLGDVAGAQRDLDRLIVLERNGGPSSRRGVVEAEIMLARGQAAEAFMLLRQYQQEKEFQDARQFSEAVSQMTGDIQEQLDQRRQQLETARANTELQRTVIRWQSWIVGIAGLFVLSALLTLIWQWRQATQLRLARQRAEAANQAKSIFLANMSHEIRTPLNGVVAMADALASRDLGVEEKSMVEIIRTSGVTLSRLLADILDSARIESGHVTIEPVPFDLGATLREVPALWQALAENKGLKLEVQTGPTIDRMVNGDAVRLRQVLNNLVSNALKFTSSGGVSLTAESVGQERVRFTVADTGPGFDPEQKSRLFGRFQQADNSITREFGGSGLGLAISNELIHLMGGQLDCDSQPGEGARFWFDIPLPPVEEAMPVSEATSGPQDAASAEVKIQPGPLRILLADDHPTNRKVIEIMLGSEVDLVSVENGQQTLETFKAGAFDLILMDMQMPVMDGLTATGLIRAHEKDSGQAPTPILMLTANAMAEHIEASRVAGASGHLTKPITMAALHDAIERVMRG